MLTSVVTVLVVLVIISALIGLYIARSMFLPTRGRRIASYPAPKKALLVLDIQESGNAGTGSAHPFPTGTRLGAMIEVVNRLIERFDKTGMEVVYVRQVFSNNLISRMHGGRIIAGRMEPRICRWVNVINDNDFAKNRTDAFSNRQLEQYLIDHQVNELYLVGLDAAICVYYTALGALNRGYRVTVVTDGVLTGRNMATVLERYQKRGITVMCSAEAASTLTTIIR
ncbi:MAG TPA: cysteine hydrolase [Desulfuromonadales bacterium]|nr:cysteine hydrolase [Desulfuromonadales bacterium]